MAAALRYGTAEEAGVDRARVRRAAQLAEGWVAEGHTSGLVVLAARRGVVVVHEASGRVTPEAGAPALPRDALYPLASVVKPLFATAVLCLVEDGLVGLNRPVQEYVPEFAGAGKEHVTVRHLLTHTAGLRDGALHRHAAERRAATGAPAVGDPHQLRGDDLFVRLDAPLATAPGAVMAYSTVGYALLAEIVRRASDQPLASFIAARITGPLGMADTSFGVPAAARHRLARRRAVGAAAAGEYAAVFEAPAAVEGVGDAGSAFSTAWDLAVFGQMFLQRGTYGGERVLSPASVAAMTRNQIPGVAMQFDDEHAPEASWGLGWSVHGPKQLRRAGALYAAQAFEHNGMGGTYLWVDPVHEVVGVYLSLLLKGVPGLFADWRADLFSNVVTAAVLDTP